MQLQTYLKEIRKQGRRSFTLQRLTSDLAVSKNAALNAICRARKRGDLISPAKGFYVIAPPEYQPQGSIPAQELTPLLMEYLKIEYYVSLLSAAEFYGASHQKSSRFQIVTDKRFYRSLEFGQVCLETAYKRSVANLPIRQIAVKTGYIKIASPELTIFDLLHYPARSGGLNHIATVLSEILESVDSKRLLELAEKIGETAWLQRLGFILEQLDYADENRSSTIVESLRKFLDGKMSTYVPLASELSKNGYPYDKLSKALKKNSVKLGRLRPCRNF